MRKYSETQFSMWPEGKFQDKRGRKTEGFLLATEVEPLEFCPGPAPRSVGAGRGEGCNRRVSVVLCTSLQSQDPYSSLITLWLLKRENKRQGNLPH